MVGQTAVGSKINFAGQMIPDDVWEYSIYFHERH